MNLWLLSFYFLSITSNSIILTFYFIKSKKTLFIQFGFEPISLKFLTKCMLQMDFWLSNITKRATIHKFLTINVIGLSLLLPHYGTNYCF